MNDKSITNVKFIEINHLPKVGDQLTPKLHVDNAIGKNVDLSTLLRLDPDEKLKLDERGCIFLKFALTSPKTVIEIPTRNYADNKFNDPSVIKNTAHVDLKDEISITLDLLK